MNEPAPPSGVIIEVTTAPRFRTQLVHGPSGSTLNTEAPKDNGGTGASFSPTDLVAAALASCALTTMELTAAREGTPWGTASAHIEKRMSPPPRQIAELRLRIEMPKELPRERREQYERVAHQCPVARSLSPSVRVTIDFCY